MKENARVRFKPKKTLGKRTYIHTYQEIRKAYPQPQACNFPTCDEAFTEDTALIKHLMAHIDSLFSYNISSEGVNIPGTERELPAYDLLPSQTLPQDPPNINSELQDDQCNNEPFDFEQHMLSDFLYNQEQLFFPFDEQQPQATFSSEFSANQALDSEHSSSLEDCKTKLQGTLLENPPLPSVPPSDDPQRRFSEEEDNHIRKYWGERRTWDEISRSLHDRTSFSVSARYRDYLAIPSQITEEEGMQYLYLQSQGLSWKEIAKLSTPGRNKSWKAIRNYFYSQPVQYTEEQIELVKRERGLRTSWVDIAKFYPIWRPMKLSQDFYNLL